MSTDKCNTCGLPNDNHDAFCTNVDEDVMLEFFVSQMLESGRKHWLAERRFNEITQSYMEGPSEQFMSKKDREYKAANDPRRKAAGASSQYHIARATMYASMISALKS